MQFGLAQSGDDQHLHLGTVSSQALGQLVGQRMRRGGQVIGGRPGRAQAELGGDPLLGAGALVGLLVPDGQHGGPQRGPVAGPGGQRGPCATGRKAGFIRNQRNRGRL